MLDDGYAIPRPSPTDTLNDTLPDELLVLTRTLTLTPEQLQQHLSKGKPPKPPLFGKQEAAILQKAVQSKLAHYETDISKDKEILAGLNQQQQEVVATGRLDTSSRRRKMAIQVRIGEKEVLESLSTKLGSFLAESSASSSSRKRDGENDDDSRRSKAQKV